jgi:hypothetical protein
MALTSFNKNELLVLQVTMQDAVNIKHTIEELCMNSETTPFNLPHSVIPTNQLYDILSAFVALYAKSLEYEIINAGKSKKLLDIVH